MTRQRRTYHWKDGKTLTVGEKTLIMGILNYTPDSFSDGGTWNDVDKALRQRGRYGGSRRGYHRYRG